MAKSFLPNTDAGLLQWAQSFSSQISATPTAFGLVAAQSTAFGTLFANYQSALNIATNESTRTKGTIAAKDSAKLTMKNSARDLAKIIEGTPTVTDQQKLDLGLTVRAMPSPIPAPSSAPTVDVISVSGRTVKLRLHSSVVAGKRGRPAGVQGASIFSYVGEIAPTDPASWFFQGSTTKTTFDVAFPTTVAAGSQVWFTAFWYNPRALSGPASAPVNTYLAGYSGMSETIAA